MKAWQHLKQDRLGLCCLIFIMLVLAAGLLSSWIAPCDPLEMDVKNKFAPWGRAHWLGTDHLDLLLVQVPDSSTSLEETAHALSLAVSSGRTRYVGIANHPAWASVRMHDLLSECGRGPGLAAVEVEHSLLSRGIERELRPASQALGFGIVGYAPLGRGVLTGKYRATIPPDSRAASPHLRSYVSPYLGEAHRGVVEAVATAASGLDCKPAEVALAWARDAPGIASTIVGARTPAQLQGVLSADDLELPVQIRHALDEVTSVQLGYPERF